MPVPVGLASVPVGLGVPSVPVELGVPPALSGGEGVGREHAGESVVGEGVGAPASLDAPEPSLEVGTLGSAVVVVSGEPVVEQAGSTVEVLVSLEGLASVEELVAVGVSEAGGCCLL